ncbi:putative membrane protein [Microbacterium terrae]|uniref:ABC-2 family transporter protein n=1 Tax=Microbacterium terrae TaxID=69369 RepID=A0A0M2H3X8_9MICO|nr:YhgE/Pip family protein [Microbacterium terrae]KJL38490.1 ABC-2 family transporter protein [Microbacterium terrae]MBP1078867.1 putative membrane protein [Microbacterium terrae]GLJ98267.1 ABC transporter [Microbacterium terrae]
MKVPQMIAAELRRLTSTRMSVIALVALLAVPILYGGLYLWANRDPYGALADVPAAIVVADTGAEVDGTMRNIGDEAADELIADGSFAWERVSAEEADAGLDDGTYDFAIEFPEDFTAAVASISSGDPQRADILLHTNDANNYLASTIGTQAVERIRTTVAEKIVAEAGLTMLDALDQIRLSLLDAADGASQLTDGLATAGDGATQLAGGAAQLAEGTSQLADGTSQLADGTAELATGASSLSDGAAQVAAGTAELAAAADRVGAASASVVSAIPDARTDIAERLTTAGLDQAQIDEVLAVLDEVGSDVTAVDDRVQSTVSSIDRLDDGAAQVRDGAAALADGTATAAAGAASAADGAARLEDGAAQLDDGAAALVTGIDTLEDGAAQLRDGLADGAAELPAYDAATREAQADTLGDPLLIERSSVTEAQNYGAGLAPFFAALAGWIGIYALFLIVKPVSKRAVTALHSPVRITLAGWATPALLGGVQMVGLFGVLALALGFSFSHPLATLGILVLASATYAAIVLALNVWLGSVGQFLGLVLMVLQLVTAGGTFPWQTLPAPLAALHHVLPMGYVVDAMRQVMYGGSMDRVLVDLTVLLTWLVGAGILAAIGVTRMTHFRTLRDLQPSIIG